MMYANLPPGKNNNASALVNLARNIGGSVGISAVTTLLDRRQQFHQSRLAEHVTPYSHFYQHMMALLRPHLGALRANGVIYQILQRQAGMLAYVDCFFVLAIAFACMIPFVLVLKPVKQRKDAAPMH
jgi:DHA2 family multidrug resistance protein